MWLSLIHIFIGVVKYLSKRYAKYGITANAVAPGPIESEMVRGLGEETYQNLLDSMPTHKPVSYTHLVL